MKNTHLLMIDPQNDFCTPVNPNTGKKAALFVSGADKDMARLAPFISKNTTRLSEIHCTLDSHQYVHIAHPIFWRNSKGEHPKPFNLITVDDVKRGVWQCFNPRWQARAVAYVETLAKNNRYVLCIWPPHCLIGTWGHSIVPEVADALYQWEESNFNKVNYVAKGSNLFTEHYSGVQADVPDDGDPSTKLNTALIDTLNEADEILITGEALSHCVCNTVTDVANNFGDDNIKKFVLLQDTSSNVGGFEKMGQDFVAAMIKRGMQVTTTKDW